MGFGVECDLSKLVWFDYGATQLRKGELAALMERNDALSLRIVIVCVFPARNKPPGLEFYAAPRGWSWLHQRLGEKKLRT